MRESYELTVPTALDAQTIFTIPAKTTGTCRVYFSGKWGGAEDLKVQHASDPRTDQDVWTDVAGNVTGAGATWVKATKDVPNEALYVALYAVTAITQGTPPLRVWLIIDEGPPA